MTRYDEWMISKYFDLPFAPTEKYKLNLFPEAVEPIAIKEIELSVYSGEILITCEDLEHHPDGCGQSYFVTLVDSHGWLIEEGSGSEPEWMAGIREQHSKS